MFCLGSFACVAALVARPVCHTYTILVKGTGSIPNHLLEKKMVQNPGQKESFSYERNVLWLPCVDPSRVIFSHLAECLTFLRATSYDGTLSLR